MLMFVKSSIRRIEIEIEIVELLVEIVVEALLLKQCPMIIIYLFEGIIGRFKSVFIIDSIQIHLSS